MARRKQIVDAKRKAQMRAWRVANVEYRKAYNKEYRDFKRSQGICTYCSKIPGTNKNGTRRKTCDACLQRIKNGRARKAQQDNG